MSQRRNKNINPKSWSNSNYLKQERANTHVAYFNRELLPIDYIYWIIVNNPWPNIKNL